MRNVISFLAAVVLTLGFGIPSQAGVQSLSLQVDGLACPFCAYGLEKKLKKVESVEKLKIDVESGRVDLTLKGDARLGGGDGLGLVSVARKAVKDGGFTAREIRATVDGVVVGVSGELRLQVPETGEELGLDGKGSELQPGSNLVVSGLVVDGEEKMKLTVEKIDRVADATASTVRLRITGLVCSGCAEAVRAAIAGVDGVQSAIVDIEEGLAEVRMDTRKVTPDQLVAAVNSAAMEGMSEGTFKASVVR